MVVRKGNDVNRLGDGKLEEANRRKLHMYETTFMNVYKFYMCI